MTLQAKIDALENLASIDAELVELRTELEAERSLLSGKQQQAAELEGRLKRSRDALGDMERQRGESVQEVRNMSVQIDKSREKLSRCRTEREANAVQRELEELRKLQRDRELEIQKLDSLEDQAREDISRTQEQLNGLAEELGQTSGETQSRLARLEASERDLEERRKHLAEKVETRLFRRYELIRKRRGSALAHTTDGRCTACNMVLPPMMFQQMMRRQDFDQCPSCNRIIYYKPPMVEEAEAAQPSGA